MTVQQFLEVVKRYFNIMPDMEDRTQVIEQISQGVSFRGANLWVLIFAIFIASLGLNVNSTAVIIGAMLISPLMGPIIGMGWPSASTTSNSSRRRGATSPWPHSSVCLRPWSTSS